MHRTNKATLPTSDTAPRASSRKRIVACSLELFSARGFNGVSMSDIARASGVTKAALYHHFADKEALFLEALQARTTRLATEVERIVSTDDDLESVLRRVAEYLLDEGLGSYRQLLSDLLTAVGEDRRAAHMQASRNVVLGIVPRLREEQRLGRIAGDVDLDLAVPLFFSMIGGQVRRLALAPRDAATSVSNRDLAALIVRIWLHGARLPATPLPE
jgi:AcrR family transcriptional regulator